jgi:precorrin-4/cobalt-precorrin-4 C11-methyltransferase
MGRGWKPKTRFGLFPVKDNAMNAKPSNPTARNSHPVYFVGAGPGDPELITVKGQRALNDADVVIYAGSLVPEALLKWTRPGSISISSAGMHLDEIIGTIESAYAAGKRVVRLHTGDPSLYGAIFEQIRELEKRSIPFHVIPGVTAAFAAAAAMNMEYTLPEISQTLILTRMAGRTPVPDSESLVSLAAHQASMAIYLSIALVDQVRDILADAYGEDAPCAIAYRVSQPEEKIIYTRIRDLSDTVRKEDITHQALIIVGKIFGGQEDRKATWSKLYDKTFSHGYRSSTGGADS